MKHQRKEHWWDDEDVAATARQIPDRPAVKLRSPEHRRGVSVQASVVTVARVVEPVTFLSRERVNDLFAAMREVCK